MRKSLVKFSVLLLSAAALLTGCATAPEYYEELSEAESAALLKQARKLALSSNRIPGHLQAVFMELPPYVRVLYDGSKHGKATFRWEMYGNKTKRSTITQQDINPYWVMVYATGDLTDPKWQLTHAYEDPTLLQKIEKMQSAPANGNNSDQSAPRQRPRQRRQVRLR